MIKKKLHFEIVSRYDKKEEPVTSPLPFGRGELKPESQERLVLRKTTGEKMNTVQYRPMAWWDDGSVKWLLIHFLADLPANLEMDYEVCLEESEENPGMERRGIADIAPSGKATERTAAAGSEAAPSVQVRKEDGGLVIDNGAIQIYLAEAGDISMFRQIVTPWHVYGKREIKGPVMVTEKDEEFFLKIGKEGWEILENGPMKAVVRASGRHVPEGALGEAQGEKTWFDYTLMITAWAGKPWLNLDYQIINREDGGAREEPGMTIDNQQAGLKYNTDYPHEFVREIRLDIVPEREEDSPVRHQIYTSSFNYHVSTADGDQKLSQLITADSVVNTANEMFPEVLFSIFAADWRMPEYGVTAGIYQAYQNFPKGIESSREGIRLELLPRINTMLKVPQGVARTTRCYLYFHGAEVNERMLVDRLHQFEMPALAVADPKEVEESGVFGDYVYAGYHHETERFLYRYVDSRAKGLGMLHFGDGPEWEYIKQGRSEGKLIWINNEYDMPHNFAVMLGRTGDRRYFDYMKAAVEHWYDVDLCHYSRQPYHEGLLYTHSVDHVSGQPVPSHQWVEGFLDYYHMTGNPNGLESAQSIGEALLELMKLPIYHQAGLVEPREIGWAMRTFMALYRETYEQRWLDACRPIVDVYVAWAKEMGTWTSPYPDNYMDRVPFMMHVGLAGLYQYYQVRPEEEVKETMLTVIDDIIRYCYIPRADMFFGKQFPAVRFQNLNGMVLESLAVAYRLTGNKAYLEKGLGMFDWITKENQPPIYDFSKYKQDDYTVVYNCPAGPKRCAQTLLPLLHYYRCIMEEHYLKNRNDS